jgi:hypothetical protein
MSVEKYLHQSLAATGFVIMSSEIAIRQRPDLWGGYMECGAEFSRAINRNQFANLPNTLRLTARLAGVARPVLILARSMSRLGERIEEITGMAVEKLEPETQSPRTVASIPPRRDAIVPDDIEHADTITREPPRSCRQCDNLANDGGCLPAMRGQFPGRPAHYRPTVTHPRRCLKYTPSRNLVEGDRPDYRTGPELWPEILAQQKGDAPPATIPHLHTEHEDATAAAKAERLLAELLKGGPRDASELRTAAEGAGISERTMQRVADALGVVKTKVGFLGGWTWALPEKAAA